jgi:hypothetical protein
VNASKTRSLQNQLTGIEELLGFCSSRKYKTDNRAKVSHLSRSNGMGRVFWKTRIPQGVDLWTQCEEPGDFQGALALLFQSQVQGGERAVSQPDFHGAWHRPLLRPKCMQTFCPCRLSRRYVAKDEVSMAREGFRIAGEGEIRAVYKWLLTEKGSSRIVYSDKGTVKMGGGDEFGKVTDIESWITGCFEPQKFCVFQQLALCIARCRSRANLNAS